MIQIFDSMTELLESVPKENMCLENPMNTPGNIENFKRKWKVAQNEWFQEGVHHIRQFQPCS